MPVNDYRIYHNKQDLENRIRSLHDNPQLAVGLLDVGSHEQLEHALAWYVENLNYDIHVLTGDDQLNVRQLQETYPSVSFIVFSSRGFSGEKINAFALECKTNYFLIVRSDAELIRFDGERLFSTMERKEHPAMVAPVLANSEREIVPCVRIPKLKEGRLDRECAFPNMADDAKADTLYPLMELGLYDRALFQRLRGYDEQIHSEYWQALDWGIRCWELGHPIYMSRTLLVQFPDRLSVIEDLSEVGGYQRCCTKALGIRQNVGGKNSARRPARDYDRESFKGEVKTRLVWLVKQDYAHVVSGWMKGETKA
jgi:hypothetical protein